MKRMLPDVFKAVRFVVIGVLTGLVTSCTPSPLMDAAPQPTELSTQSSKPKILDSGWESSGGDGVVCFSSPAVAQEFENDYPQVGLSDALKAKIKNAFVLDYWEAPNRYTYDQFRQYPSLRAAQQAFRNRLTTFENPGLLAQYEREARTLIHSEWWHLDSVPEVDDSVEADFIREQSPECRLIQIATRFFEPRGKGRVFIVVNRWLFENKLDVVNQLALINHEILYALARSLGELNSDTVRPLNSWLLSDQFSPSLNPPRAVHTLLDRISRLAPSPPK